MSDDIDRTGYREGLGEGVTVATLVQLLCALLETHGDECRLTSEDLRDQLDFTLAMDADPERADGLILRRIGAFSEDERVPSGSYLQAMSGMVVWVLGLTPTGRVAVLHDKDTELQHRADEELESFLKRHVPYSTVPLLGGDS
jgi:hypothetical protein